MDFELDGEVDIVVMQQELNSQEQGADRAYFPCMWDGGRVLVNAVQIHFQTVPANQHSFSVFKTGAGSPFAAVTKTTSGKFAITRGLAESFEGGVDFWSVRHDTNAQDADEMSGAHVDEGGRITVALLGRRA
jgi:hypothetical protein